MALRLDETDVRILGELQADADRANVDLARIIGLSPTATLNRVRRLKEAGTLAAIRAEVDPDVAGFPLQVHIQVVLGQHDERAEQRFARVVRGLSHVVSADWVAGEVDALLHVVARDVAELQQVLLALSGKGGAARLVTHLRLGGLKPRSPLPLAARPG